MWLLIVLILAAFSCPGTALDTINVMNNTELALTRHGNGTYEMQFSLYASIKECRMKSPSGEIYEIFPSYDVLISNFSRPFSACGIRITDMNVDLQGNWTFLATIKPFGAVNETHHQQSLNLVVEEYVVSSPGNFFTTYIGEDLFLKFNYSFKPNSCIVKTPNSPDYNSQLKSQIHVDENCSVELRKLAAYANGDWVFGAVADFTELSNVTINMLEFPAKKEFNVDLMLNFPTTLTMGLKEAIYCKAVGPQNDEYIFNKQCSIEIDRIRQTHAGVWKVYSGLMNTLRVVEYTYYVTVTENNDAPHPTTIKESVQLSQDNKTLFIRCALRSETKGCRMIQSNGTTLIMSPGVGYGRYSYYGEGVYKDKDGFWVSECGVRVEHPEVEDFKPWQCIMVMPDDREMGKIVTTPRNIDWEGDGENDVINSPPESKEINVVSYIGNTLELMCKHTAKIDYCWFMSPNKRMISTVPGFVNNEFEYMGEGLELGECGLRIFNATRNYNGLWKCNMGGESGIDVTQDIRVVIEEKLVVPFNKRYWSQQNLTIGCKTYKEMPLEYCRFIRPDGVGINPVKVSQSYEGNSTSLTTGLCEMIIPRPRFEDIGLWACVAKPFEQREHFDTFYVARVVTFTTSSTSMLILSIICYIVIAVSLTYIIIRLLVKNDVPKRCATKIRESVKKFKKTPQHSETSSA